MAEATAKSIEGAICKVPGNRQFYYVKGTIASTGDTLTVSTLTTVEGAFLMTTAGALPTSVSLATNVITITASAATFSGLVWGT